MFLNYQSFIISSYFSSTITTFKLILQQITPTYPRCILPHLFYYFIYYYYLINLLFRSPYHCTYLPVSCPSAYLPTI